ncbi:universal stress protein [Rhodococcoides kroppenstedtii]|uniref:universal stress protein n=1 Tax=Rhodococcoides kroppenstedtii TaxID=293050 RepID=UPI00352FFBD7|nr:universal stress protein [Rhodococcus kroppenstedtii]
MIVRPGRPSATPRRHPEVTRLVIGIRKRSRVGKALLGSTSQRLLMLSPVPVLTVRPE